MINVGANKIGATNVGANVLTFAVPVWLENVPRAATLPLANRRARNAAAGSPAREQVERLPIEITRNPAQAHTACG